jgi:hypothetical protein
VVGREDFRRAEAALAQSAVERRERAHIVGEMRDRTI